MGGNAKDYLLRLDLAIEILSRLYNNGYRNIIIGYGPYPKEISEKIEELMNGYISKFPIEEYLYTKGVSNTREELDILIEELNRRDEKYLLVPITNYPGHSERICREFERLNIKNNIRYLCPATDFDKLIGESNLFKDIYRTTYEAVANIIRKLPKSIHKELSDIFGKIGLK